MSRSKRRIIGRERELSILESAFGSPSAFLLYGRRRIGKTFLLESFCEGKRNLFLRCIEDSDNLQYMADAISDFVGEPRDRYRGYYDVFKDIARICAEEPTVVVMDEFQFLAAEAPEVTSLVQHFIDGQLKDTESMLILCGSSVRFMRALGEDGRNPLFGRFKRIIRLGPLSFEECRGFHPGMSDIDQLRLYLTVGGVPRYHEEMTQDTYGGCIRENFLGDGWMVEESNNLIRAEFSPSDRYLAVLSAISEGAVQLKEISEAVHVEPSTCLVYLRELREAGIVGVVNPMMGAPKRTRYYVEDAMSAFYNEILVRRRVLVERIDRDSALEELRTHIDTFLGRRFELFCAGFIKRNYPVAEIGRWWRDDPRKGIHEDIDIVARLTMSGVRVDLFVECKFTRARAGFHEYNLLDRRADALTDGYNGRLCIISVSGFEPELEEFAEGAGVILIGPDELFGRREPEAVRLRPALRRAGRVSDPPVPPHFADDGGPAPVQSPSAGFSTNQSLNVLYIDIELDNCPVKPISIRYWRKFDWTERSRRRARCCTTPSCRARSRRYRRRWTLPTRPGCRLRRSSTASGTRCPRWGSCSRGGSCSSPTCSAPPTA